MSLYEISVKAEPDYPDWAVASSNIDSNKSENSADCNTNASEGPINNENENSSNVDLKETGAESSSNEPVAATEEALRVSTPGYHRRPVWYTKARSSNFTKQECQLFLTIVNKYSHILFNAKTDNATNRLKKVTWEKIDTEFNANSTNRRTLRQLQAKFDNLKRSRRKLQRQRSEDLDIRFNQKCLDLPKVMVIPSLSTIDTSNCVSTEVADDEQDCNVDMPVAAILQPPAEEPHSTAPIIDPLAMECSEVLDPSVLPSLPQLRYSQGALHTPSRPRFRKRVKPTEVDEKLQKLRQSKLEALHCTSQYDRILFETKLQHLEEKRNEEKEIYELKKRKLELEISLLEKQNK